MELNIWKYYSKPEYAGQVQLLGPDIFNGTPAQLTSFKNSTGATYPLLLLGGSSTGGNIADLYANGVVGWDNYVVISKQGIIRYHAALTWPHGNRYHLDEIRGSVDTLVTQVAAVPGGPSASEIALSVAPNPSAGRTWVTLAVPAWGLERACVSVLDVRGRRLATLWDGPAASGTLRLEWDGMGPDGRVDPGVYFFQADLDGCRLQRRMVIVR